MITRTFRNLQAFQACVWLLFTPALSWAQDTLSNAPASSPVSNAVRSENPATSQSFSLQQAIDYALQTNINAKNAQLDIESAKARIGEIRAIGLPQLSFQGQVIDNVKIPTSFLPGVFFDPQAGPDAPPVPVQFGVQYTGSATFSANQLLFDGSYFVGLKAASVYNQLSRKTATQTKVGIVENVTKAYYAVLVSDERLALLDYNVKRLDTLLQQTRLQYENGFVEKIDVDRIEVQHNNLKVDQRRTIRLVELSRALLKFQMGYDVNAPIEVTDKLALQNIDTYQIESVAKIDYGQRIEYSLLQTQKELNQLDLRNIRAGYLPNLQAFGSYGFNRGSNQFDLLKEQWFSNAIIGLTLNVPIFDGLTKYYKSQQAKLTYQKTVQSQKLLEQSIDLQLQQANITLENNLDVLRTQQRNLELAEKVADVTRIKYQQGVGSNIEVINAEASLKEAQTNFYSALYDALVAKVDLDKAAGRLYTE